MNIIYPSSFNSYFFLNNRKDFLNQLPLEILEKIITNKTMNNRMSLVNKFFYERKLIYKRNKIELNLKDKIDFFKILCKRFPLKNESFKNIVNINFNNLMTAKCLQHVKYFNWDTKMEMMCAVSVLNKEELERARFCGNTNSMIADINKVLKVREDFSINCNQSLENKKFFNETLLKYLQFQKKSKVFYLYKNVPVSLGFSHSMSLQKAVIQNKTNKIILLLMMHSFLHEDFVKCCEFFYKRNDFLNAIFVARLSEKNASKDTDKTSQLKMWENLCIRICNIYKDYNPQFLPELKEIQSAYEKASYKGVDSHRKSINFLISQCEISQERSKRKREGNEELELESATKRLKIGK